MAAAAVSSSRMHSKHQPIRDSRSSGDGVADYGQGQVDPPGGGDVRDADQPLGAAGDVDVEYGDAHHLAEGQGGDGEKHAAQPQDRQADHQPHHAGQQRPGRQGQKVGDPQLHGQDPGGIAADAGKGGAAQRELARRQGSDRGSGPAGN